jgi:putative ABC transport system permease protein
MRSLIFLFKFSLRNLSRSWIRTLIIMTSLAMSTAYIVWALNFAESGSAEVMKDFLRRYMGRYQIVHSDFYTGTKFREFSIYKTISMDGIPETLKDLGSPRIVSPVFVSGTAKTVGVILTGIDVEKELSKTSLHQAVMEGKYLSPQGRNEIVIGKRLAKKIQSSVGDEVALLGQATDGSIANDIYTVVGVLDFGGGDFEDSLAFTQINSLREFLTISENQFHQFVVFSDSSIAYPQIKNLKVVGWEELLPEISVSVKFIDGFTWMISFIIVIVVCLGLSNTLMVTFTEREEEFKALTTIGASGSWIIMGLILEVAFVTVISITLGVVIGHLVTLYHSIYPIDMKLFTNGKAILIGGMEINPYVRIIPVAKYYWQVPLLIIAFVSVTLILPLVRVLKRSRGAI